MTQKAETEEFVLTINSMKANAIILGFSSSNKYPRRVIQVGPCLLIESRAKVHMDF